MSYQQYQLQVVGRNQNSNIITKVAAFLEERHKDSYLIFNLSCRKYDYKKFKGMVLEYKWEDHHSPAMNVLFEVCQEMYKFLKKNPNHIVIVNCNAGKGRTGTSIASFLMFSGLAENAADAITYYGWKRFEHGRGVTQPSQPSQGKNRIIIFTFERYVHYFEGVYKRMIQSPSIKILDKIVITTVPKISDDGIRPYIEVLSGKDFELIWTNKHSQNLKSYKNQDQNDYDENSRNSIKQTGGNPGSAKEKRLQKIVINIDKDPLLCGDIYFRLLHKGSLKNKLVCRFALNTSFIQENVYEFTKQTVDPDSIVKDNRISWDFKIQLFFRDFCTICEPSMSIDKLCPRCIKYMGDEVKSWRIIKEILDNHQYPGYQDGVMTNFNSSQCDYHEIIKKKIPINCETMQYFQEEQSDSDYEYDDYQDNKQTGMPDDPFFNSDSYNQAFENNQEESKGSHDQFKPLKKESLNQRDAYSDTEEESNGKASIIRKVDMLQVNDVDQEFELKSGCLRKKSQDFNREKNQSLAKMVQKDMPERFDQEIRTATFQTKRANRKASIQQEYFQ